MPDVRLLNPGDIDAVKEAAEIVRAAFSSVAARFDITKEKYAAYPAFLTDRHLLSALKSQYVYGYCVYVDQTACGFYILRVMREDKILDVSRLCVSPGRQGEGIGTFALACAAQQGACLGMKKLHLDVVDEDEDCKDWLKRRGFEQAGRLKYAGMPYRVAFMEKPIEKLIEQ